jgi:K+-transporting ATPase ATPase C chain
MALLRQAWTGLRLLVVATLVLGLAYPLAVFAVGRLDPTSTNGSFVEFDGRVVGSDLIGQSFEGGEWFQARPSAAGDGYDPLASGASNLGPNNADLLASIQERRSSAAGRDGIDPASVPADALTASGSGLDPHISPEYARQQVDRVAAQRGLPVDQVTALVDDRTEARLLGFIGEPRVNVLRLNLELAALEG